MQRLFFSILLFPIAFSALAQNADSVGMRQTNKAVLATDPQTGHNQEIVSSKTDSSPDVAGAHPFVTPKKTALFSAILPGLGQAYNHQYWKIPVIYAGLGVAAYFINDNLKNYNTFRRIYAGRISGDPAAFKGEYADYPDETVRQARDYYRKNLDLTVLLTAVGYTVQILDAVVFAHLKNFDIGPDISLRARPVALPRGGLGIGLVMNF